MIKRVEEMMYACSKCGTCPMHYNVDMGPAHSIKHFNMADFTERNADH